MRVPTAQRPALLGLAGIALLAVGFLVGTLLHPSSSSTGGSATPSAASVEVGFAQDMIVHHRQAVQMANAETGSADPLVASLAFDIASTQQVQIGQMQGWLSLWGQPLLTTGGYMAWMPPMADAPMTGTGGTTMSTVSAVSTVSTVSADGSVAEMPGMASTDELRQLREATGRAKDVLFLQLVLRHHQGGAGMLDVAAQQAADPAVRTFAEQVSSSQQAEVVTMTDLLAARDARPLPTGR